MLYIYENPLVLSRGLLSKYDVIRDWLRTFDRARVIPSFVSGSAIVSHSLISLFVLSSHSSSCSMKNLLSSDSSCGCSSYIVASLFFRHARSFDAFVVSSRPCWSSFLDSHVLISPSHIVVIKHVAQIVGSLCFSFALVAVYL